MDDLISRSALLDEIESLSVHITGLRSGKGVLADCMKEYKKSVLRIIDEQPTAYDAEKVVENINNIDTRRNWNSSCEECINHTTCKEIYNEEAKTKSNHLCSQVIKKLAIKEVRKGGME